MKNLIRIASGILLLSLAVFLYFTLKEVKVQNEPEPILSEIPKILVSYEYDIIPVDSFQTSDMRIKWNENFNIILRNLHIDSEKRETLNSKIAAKFDLRKIKAGNYYTVYNRSENQEPEFIVYKHSQTEFLIINIENEEVYFQEKEIQTIQKSSEGIIHVSLWNTMIDNNMNPELSIRLSEIYAWSIDFFGLQKGDYFKVIYDEQIIDDTISIGIGNIYAAVFNHMGTNYFAFSYEQDGEISYWDEKGNSLRKAFLKAPLKYARISSKFSGRRFHPILKIYRPHSGVDYAAPQGTPVYSIGDGIVTRKGKDNAAGNYLYIKHNSVYTTQYNHLYQFANGISTGKTVKQGQLIGYVGKTGYATGPHLDFRMYKNGQAVDPLKVKAPSVKPISEDNLSNYQQIRNEYINELIDFDLRPYAIPNNLLFAK